MLKSKHLIRKINQKNNLTKKTGFTIVELLVVIVIIGILATITIVAYTGITQQAVTSSLKTDLVNGSNRLKMYYAEHNSTYPSSMVEDGNNTYCPTPDDTEYCIKASPGNTFTYLASSPYKAFILEAKNTATNIKYRITENTNPIQVAVFFATGGTKTIDGIHTVHLFTSSGTLTTTGDSTDAEVLVVAGGGGSGNSAWTGSAGGAGGYLTGTVNLSGSMPVVVGNGGNCIYYGLSENGGNSSFGSLVAIGGGAGGEYTGSGHGQGPTSGGSGGGGWADNHPAGAGTPGQGYAGGFSPGLTQFGGGGGAGGVGGSYADGGCGGPGIYNDIVKSGTMVGYAGGGASYGSCTSQYGGGLVGQNGSSNTGGGGGGGGGNGGSGIVVIRYLTP